MCRHPWSGAWAPRAKTPILRRVGRHHTKVALIGTTCAKPGRRKSTGVYFRIHRGRNLAGAGCRELLRQQPGNIAGPVIVVWVRLIAHRSAKVKTFVAKLHDCLLLRCFPAYAPEFSPIETAWAYLKGKVLANHTPANADEHFQAAKRGLRRMRSSRDLVYSFIEHSGLSHLAQTWPLVMPRSIAPSSSLCSCRAHFAKIPSDF